MSFWVTHFTLIFNCVRELPRCGADAGSLRFEKEGARLAAKVSFLFCTF